LLEVKWSNIRDVRAVVLDAIEPMRREKQVGSSLEAEVVLRCKAASQVEAAQSIDITEICIAASVEISGFADDKIAEVWTIDRRERTDRHKCGRCWRHLPEVTENGALCSRCDQVVASMDAVA